MRGVDLKIKRKQIIGLVGESGAGKSVTSKSLLNINEFDITEVDVMKLYSKKDFNSNEIEEVDLKKLKKNEWINIRGKKNLNGKYKYYLADLGLGQVINSEMKKSLNKLKNK